MARPRSIVKKIVRLLRELVPVVAFVYLGYVYLTLPDVRPLATTNPTTTAFIELRKREAQQAGRKFAIRQRWVPYTQISTDLRRAVLVAEDAAFFDHDGIDLKELRASLERNWEEGRFARGASTITQQLAKNLYLSPSRNPIRKLKELFITRRLEAALTKRRILEIYLNVIEWGDGIFGAKRRRARTSASRPRAWRPEEAALLAGAIINPREHSPANPTRAIVTATTDHRAPDGHQGNATASATVAERNTYSNPHRSDAAAFPDAAGECDANQRHAALRLSRLLRRSRLPSGQAFQRHSASTAAVSPFVRHSRSRSRHENACGWPLRAGAIPECVDGTSHA